MRRGCQGTLGAARWRSSNLPADGHQICPVVAIRRAWQGLVQGADSFSGEGLGEADAVAAGLADVGVVH